MILLLGRPKNQASTRCVQWEEFDGSWHMAMLFLVLDRRTSMATCYACSLSMKACGLLSPRELSLT